MENPAKVLIVDDEEDIVEFLKYNLEKEGYIVYVAYDGKEALKVASEIIPHIIVLDIMMPEFDGIEVCEKLREDPKFNNTLIAFLTARSESFTQISALDMGGDDFINKPIKPNVFKARIKALLRRHPEYTIGTEAQIVYGALTINPEQFTVKLDQKDIVVAKKEFELLNLLASKPGKVFKRSEILSKVWGNSVIVGDRTIDVHIRKLREKIGSHYIHTMKGVGYKFDY